MSKRRYGQLDTSLNANPNPKRQQLNFDFNLNRQRLFAIPLASASAKEREQQRIAFANAAWRDAAEAVNADYEEDQPGLSKTRSRFLQDSEKQQTRIRGLSANFPRFAEQVRKANAAAAAAAEAATIPARSRRDIDVAHVRAAGQARRASTAAGQARKVPAAAAAAAEPNVDALVYESGNETEPYDNENGNETEPYDNENGNETDPYSVQNR